ncbi:uncharacterized protein LOC119799177 [Cyprinodon tularosa]|uniref:uncharacterized protein LOC119799177 n=1 Tax=Cyprinodon tularosa TaxID=77115 RepID=UPI0018E207E0|nr:uncharacterized protein LOC119799177 [Cyprinodon tularosa]
MAGSFQGNCLCGVLGAGLFMAGCAFFIIAAFPVVQIALGLVYREECPIRPVIPVYVMVFGVLALLVMAMFTLPKLVSPAAESQTIWKVGVAILLLASFSWLLFGSYHIYSIYPPNYKKNITGSTRRTATLPAPDSLTASQNHSLQNLTHTPILLGLNLTGSLNTTDGRIDRNQANNQQPLPQLVAVSPYCSRTVYMFAFWTTTLVHVFLGNALLIIICLFGFMKCIDVFVKQLKT